MMYPYEQSKKALFTYLLDSLYHTWQYPQMIHKLVGFWHPLINIS